VKTFKFYLSSAILLLAFTSKANNTDGENFIHISVEQINDKIRGGLLGQILGNLNGLPHEMKYIEEPGNVEDYVPSLPDGAWTDDDTDFEWMYIYEMQKRRNVFLSTQDIYELWKERINNRIWCSNLYARYLMDIGIHPPYTGYQNINPWAEFNISGQFLCETFGLVAPAMPQTAAKIGLNYTTVAIGGEPAQTTQLFTSMIATAFIESDVNKILVAGMKALDENSKVLQVCKDVKEWYNENPTDWRKTRQLLKNKYTQEDGKIRDKNGFELNTGAIIAALLYGNGEFSKSLELAFNFGWDADCNAATVGTIIGVIYGYKKMLNHSHQNNLDWQIVDRYKNTTRDNMPMDETITSFADRIIELFGIINQQNGGKKLLKDKILVYEIPVEKPAPIISLNTTETQKELEMYVEQWFPGESREEKARAVYLSVCFGLNDSMAKKYPDQWDEACYELSGYWKIIHNIFSVNNPNNEFEAMKVLRKKFHEAGFKAPKKAYSNQELWTDMEVWKDPDNLY
jgi:ADP-ribosylglycohydrolase